METLPPRLVNRIEVDDAGCWIWTGGRNSSGYGACWWSKRQQVAHRVVYEILAGPIPEGLTLDHLCRVRACVNPSHLEAVTMRENILRGEGVSAGEARKTHCPRGHPYDAENTYHHPDGSRRCRICGREHVRDQRCARLI